MSKILIQNASLLDPASGRQTQGDLAIADGFIVGVGTAPDGFAPELSINAAGCIAMPGLVDLRARPGMPVFHGSGALECELEVAARYGITSLVCPPDTNPHSPLDDAGTVDMLRHGAEQHGGTRLYPLGALTRRLEGTELANLQTLERAGCVGFSQGERPLFDKRMLHRAMQYAATGGQTLWLRPLDPELGLGVAASGALATRMGLEGVPEAAETLALHTIFALMRAVPGIRVHVQGLSCAASVDLLRAAKTEGLPVTADVSIHSLHLTDADIGYFDSRARVNPPLRSQRDRAALQAALADGTIDALVSDHSRVNLDGKALPFAQAQAGARGMELLLSLALHWAQNAKLPLAQALAAISSRPAAVLGQSAALAVGSVADICVFDPEAMNPINQSASFAQLTPFAHEISGFHLPGVVRATLVAGKTVFSAL
jgi:dihydroorotase